MSNTVVSINLILDIVLFHVIHSQHHRSLSLFRQIGTKQKSECTRDKMIIKKNRINKIKWEKKLRSMLTWNVFVLPLAAAKCQQFFFRLLRLIKIYPQRNYSLKMTWIIGEAFSIFIRLPSTFFIPFMCISFVQKKNVFFGRWQCSFTICFKKFQLIFSPFHFEDHFLLKLTKMTSNFHKEKLVCINFRMTVLFSASWTTFFLFFSYSLIPWSGCGQMTKGKI